MTTVIYTEYVKNEITVDIPDGVDIGSDECYDLIFDEVQCNGWDDSTRQLDELDTITEE